MKIEYPNTFEDIIEFSKYNFINSGNYKKHIITGYITYPVMSVIVIFFLSLVTNMKLQVMIPVLLICYIVFLYFYKYIVIERYAKVVADQIRENGESEKGKIELEITETGITERSCNTEQNVKWEAITKVVDLENYTYVYFSQAQVIIIPKYALLSGNIQDFLLTLKEKTQKKFSE